MKPSLMRALMLLTGFPLIGLVLFFIIPWKLALPVYILGVGASVLLQRVAMKSHRLPVLTGIPAMTGAIGTVTVWETDRGTVRFRAELWRARSECGESIAPGAEVRIVAVENLELVVAPEALSRGGCPGGTPRPPAATG
jgi:membrane-bound ClpP family serine protease